MTKEELISQIEKLLHKWQYHAIEHRTKRDNNSPHYDAHKHGVAVGYLKALTTIKGLVKQLEER